MLCRYIGCVGGLNKAVQKVGLKSFWAEVFNTHMVTVEVKDMIEEVFELCLLEGGEEAAALRLLLLILLRPLYEGGPGVLHPPGL